MLWGYTNFLQAMTDPEHEDHADMKQWIGGKFDPEKLSVDEVKQGAWAALLRLDVMGESASRWA